MKKFIFESWSDRLNAATIFASFGLLVGVVGCGKASDPTPVGVGNIPGSSIGGCPVGQYPSNGACVADYSATCRQAYGIPTGPKSCQFNIYGASGILTPDTASGQWAGPGMPVVAGSVISFSGQGGWSASSSNTTSVLGGLFNISWGSANCFSTQVDLNGNKSGSILSNLGLPAGLVGSDGTEVFAVGSSLPSKTITHNGTLHFGFNIPLGQNSPSMSNYVCGSYSGVLNITVP